MAGDFIKVSRTDTQATHAFLLIEFISTMRDAYSRGSRLREIMRHNFTGNDFSSMEALFGLPVGTGQTVFTLMDGAIGSMENQFTTDAAKVITERVG